MITNRFLKHLTDTEKAYIAGIFDGEGCICIDRTERSSAVKLSIVSTTKSLIDWLHETTGIGSVMENKSYSPKHKRQYRWMVSTRPAKMLCEAIRPWLIIKAAQVDLVFDYFNNELHAGSCCGKTVSPEQIAKRFEYSQNLSQLKLDT